MNKIGELKFTGLGIRNLLGEKEGNLLRLGEKRGKRRKEENT